MIELQDKPCGCENGAEQKRMFVWTGGLGHISWNYCNSIKLEAIASRFSLVGDGFDALRPARVSEASHVQAGAWKWLCVLG